VAARTRKTGQGAAIEAVIDKARRRAGDDGALEALLPTPATDAAPAGLGVEG